MGMVRSEECPKREKSLDVICEEEKENVRLSPHNYNRTEDSMQVNKGRDRFNLNLV